LATASIPILLLTCGLALAKPKFGEFRVRQGAAGLLGGVLTLAVGAVSLEQFANTMRFLFAPVVTIVSLMALTLVAEQTGLFRVLASKIAQRAEGDGPNAVGSASQKVPSCNLLQVFEIWVHTRAPTREVRGIV
jgi:Na+/H+ antiporter NhaD/arsenite permease-like protein